MFDTNLNRDPNSPRSRSEVFPFEGGREEPDTTEVWQPFAKTEANYFLLGETIFSPFID